MSKNKSEGRIFDREWRADPLGVYVFDNQDQPVLEVRYWGKSKGTNAQKIRQQIALSAYVTRLHNERLEKEAQDEQE